MYKIHIFQRVDILIGFHNSQRVTGMVNFREHFQIYRI